MTEAPTHELPRLPMPGRRSWWLSLSMGLALLLCGAIIGGSVTALYLFDRLMTTIHEPEKVPNNIVERMRGTLDLSDEQAEKIEIIYSSLQKELVVIRDTALPEVERKLEEARVAVNGVLTPEQAELYNRRFDRLRKTLIPLRD